MKFLCSFRNIVNVALVLGMSLTMVIGSAARAEVTIDITRGNVEPMPIAITDFFSVDKNMAEVGLKISEVVRNDLERSGLFRPIDKKAFIQTVSSLNVQPRYSDWRVINAQVLVGGEIKLRENGQIRVEFRLWDVFANRPMAGPGSFHNAV